jgi:2-iminobutanoate/2-iminopropanoate deaminase
MNTHLVIALIAGVIAVGSAAARAHDHDRDDDDNARKIVISTPLAPAAIGPYSQAIRVGRTVYLSGQIAIDPTTNTFDSNASIRTKPAESWRIWLACLPRPD